MGLPQMSGLGNSGESNVPQYFQNKYGCTDCFVKQPYPFEYPKPIIPMVNKKTLLERILHKLAG